MIQAKELKSKEAKERAGGEHYIQLKIKLQNINI